MDQRIEAFLTDVLALAGEDPDAVREGVRSALADCEAIFRVKTQAHEGQGRSRLPRAVPRSRDRGITAAKGTQIAEHLKLGRNLDRPGRVLSLTARRFPPPGFDDETTACFTFRDAG